MEREEWRRAPGREPDYCDAVLLAQHQTMPRSGSEHPPPEEVSAYERLGIAADFLTTEAAQIETDKVNPVARKSHCAQTRLCTNTAKARSGE